MYEGTVIARHGGGISETFTVRRVAYGCGVEKTFPIHSPNVAKVEVIRKGKVRRAKLYYIRERVGNSSDKRKTAVSVLRYGSRFLFHAKKIPQDCPTYNAAGWNSAGFLYKGYSASSMFCTVRSIVF